MDWMDWEMKEMDKVRIDQIIDVWDKVRAQIDIFDLDFFISFVSVCGPPNSIQQLKYSLAYFANIYYRN